MKYICLTTILMALAIGCQATRTPVISPEPQLTEHVDGARGEVVNAKATLKGKDYVATDKHLDNAIVHLDAEKTVIVTVSKTAVDTETKLEASQSYVQAHSNDFFGPRAHRDFWWLAISGSIISLILGALKVWAPSSGIFSIFWHILMAICTCGLSAIHWCGTKIMSLFVKKTVTTVVTPTTVAK